MSTKHTGDRPPGDDDYYDSKASGVCGPPQGEAARILGEGCRSLVQAGRGSHGGQPRGRAAGDVQDSAPTHPTPCV